jgi:hypothetical protein
MLAELGQAGLRACAEFADLGHKAHEARELMRLLGGLQSEDVEARLVVSVLQCNTV